MWFVAFTDIYPDTRFKPFRKIGQNFHSNFAFYPMGMAKASNNQKYRLAVLGRVCIRLIPLWSVR